MSAHLPLPTEMFIHGKQDRAGRLLTDDDRHAAHPNHEYWQMRCTELEAKFEWELSDAQLDELSGIMDTWPDGITWIAAYRALLAFDTARLEAQHLQVQEETR